MKIQKITIYKAAIPLKYPFKIALGTIEVAENIFIKIETNEGVYGWGEASPFSLVVGETPESSLAQSVKISKFLIKADPRNINTIDIKIKKHFPFNPTIRSAFNMALYDILGKVSELPLFRLLGGADRDLITDFTIGINTPEEMALHAEKIKEKGAQIVKIKVGEDVKTDILRLKTVRKALGSHISIRVDANQSWRRSDALLAASVMQDLDIELCEQPVQANDITSLSIIRNCSPILIIADESVFNGHDALRLILGQACDGFNIKLAKAGSIQEAVKIAMLAESAHLECMIGCMMETRLGLTAAAHLAAALPVIKYVDLDSAEMHSIDFITGGIEYRSGGRIVLPEKPGLGVDIDKVFLKNLEKITIK